MPNDGSGADNNDFERIQRTAQSPANEDKNAVVTTGETFSGKLLFAVPDLTNDTALALQVGRVVDELNDLLTLARKLGLRVEMKGDYFTLDPTGGRVDFIRINLSRSVLKGF